MGYTILYRTADASLQHEVGQFVAEWENGAETFTVFTSGSTGKPKSIVLKREQLIASARRTLEYFDLYPGDTALLGISPKTIGGKMMIVRALISELKLIVCSPSVNPLSALEPGETLDFCPMVPLQAQHMLQNDPESLLRIRNILFGGAPLSDTLEQQLLAVHSACYAGFGMTETVSHVAMRKLGDPVYMALRGVHFRQENGCLVITDAELAIPGLLTNDVVNLIDARRFTWLGRSDFAINSGGVKIHPEQLEHVLADLIHGPFFVSSEPDDTFGESCILIVDETLQTPPFGQLQAHCRQHIGPYAAPKKLYRVPVVFANGTKINRPATLQQIRTDQ